jgi:hypothetical protein
MRSAKRRCRGSCLLMIPHRRAVSRWRNSECQPSIRAPGRLLCISSNLVTDTFFRCSQESWCQRAPRSCRSDLLLCFRFSCGAPPSYPERRTTTAANTSPNPAAGTVPQTFRSSPCDLPPSPKDAPAISHDNIGDRVQDLGAAQGDARGARTRIQRRGETSPWVGKFLR